MRRTSGGTVLIVGQAARDLVLSVDGIPEGGGSSPVLERIERLGGKGANQAVGMRQLGADVALLAVFGADSAGQAVLDEALASGIDLAAAVRRGRTALLVDVVEADGTRRLLEDVPPSSLLRESDVRAAAEAFVAADTVCLQLQQPADALLAAADLANQSGARIVLDGGIEGDARDRLLGVAGVVRADATEAAALSGTAVESREDAARAARRLLAAGPELVALGVPGEGDLVAWDGGERFFPFSESRIVDPTGAGDAFLSGLVVALRAGADPEAAGGFASSAAGATVERLGGHPDLRGLRVPEAG